MMSNNEKINELYTKSILKTTFLNEDGSIETKSEFDIDIYTNLVILEFIYNGTKNFNLENSKLMDLK